MMTDVVVLSEEPRLAADAGRRALAESPRHGSEARLPDKGSDPQGHFVITEPRWLQYVQAMNRVQPPI
jgi:hypothetical protein